MDINIMYVVGYFFVTLLLPGYCVYDVSVRANSSTTQQHQQQHQLEYFE